MNVSPWSALHSVFSVLLSPFVRFGVSFFRLFLVCYLLFYGYFYSFSSHSYFYVFGWLFVLSVAPVFWSLERLSFVVSRKACPFPGWAS